MHYNWTEILLAHEYFKNSKIQYNFIDEVKSSLYNSLPLGGTPSIFDIYFHITGNRIQSPEIHYNIEKLNGLEFLFLRELDLDNIFPISKLISVKVVSCEINEIDSLVPLKEMKELTKIDFANNRIHDLNPLLELAKLESIDFSGNQITDVYPLSKMNHLKELYLAGNNITSINSISGLLNLEHLNLTNNKIKSISGLYNLKRLKSLNIGGGNSIPNEELVELKRQLPNCVINIEYYGDEVPLEVELIINDNLVYFLNTAESSSSFHVTLGLFDSSNNSNKNIDVKCLENLAAMQTFKSKRFGHLDYKRSHTWSETVKSITVQFDY